MLGGTKEETKKESFVNLRPFAFAAVALAAGVCFCFGSLYCGLPFFVAFLSLPVAALPLLFSARKRLAALCFFTFLLFLGLGMGGFALQITRFENQPLCEGTYTLTGRVVSFTQGDERSFLLLEKITADGGEYDGRTALYVYAEGTSYTRGETVRLKANVKPAGRAYRYRTFLADSVTQDIRYTATAAEPPVITKGSSDPFGLLERMIRDALYENLSGENAGLSCALTTGNTDGVEEGLLSSVRYGGVAHLFAVSGLHVGAVFLALRRLCNRGKLPAWARVAIPAAFAFLFCGACGFSISSLRAFLILTVAEGVKVIGLRADGIELTAFACIALSLFSPAQLFSVGFQLSVSAYAGAALFSLPFTRRINTFFARACPGRRGIIKFLHGLLNTLAVTACAQICILPVCLLSFGYASLWGMLLNLFLLPLFAVCFPVLLACVLLACLLPFAAGAFLFLPSLALSLFSAFFYLCDFSGALLGGFTLSALGAAAYYLLLALFGGRLNFKKSGIGRGCLCAALAAALLFDCTSFGTAAFDDCRITHMCYYENFCCSLVECGGEHVLLLNGKAPESRMRTFLYRHGVKLTAVVVVSEDPAACVNGMMNFSFGDIYLPADAEVGLQTHSVHAEREFSIGRIRFSYLSSDLLRLTVDGVSGVFNGEAADADFTLFSAEGRDGLIFRINRGILR